MIHIYCNTCWLKLCGPEFEELTIRPLGFQWCDLCFNPVCETGHYARISSHTEAELRGDWSNRPMTIPELHKHLDAPTIEEKIHMTDNTDVLVSFCEEIARDRTTSQVCRTAILDLTKEVRRLTTQKNTLIETLESIMFGRTSNPILAAFDVLSRINPPSRESNK